MVKQACGRFGGRHGWLASIRNVSRPQLFQLLFNPHSIELMLFIFLFFFIKINEYSS